MNHRQGVLPLALSVGLTASLVACGGGGGGGGGPGIGAKILPILRDSVGGGAFDAAGPSGCVPDTAEPNDSAAQARALAVGQPLTLNFCDDGSDLFVLSTSPGQRYVIDTSALEVRADTVLRVESGAGQVVAENDDSAGLASRVEFVAAPDQAEVRVIVTPFDPDTGTGEDTGYVLTARTTDATGQPDLVLDGFSISGFAGTRSFEFSVDIGNQGDAFAAPTVAFYLSADDTLERSTDQFFAETSGDQVAPGGTAELRGQLTVPAGAVGEFFVILAVDDQNFVAETNENNNVLATGAPANLSSNVLENCHEDVLEPNDGPEFARLIEPGDDLSARLCADTDDWFVFEAEPFAVYDLSTSGLGPLADTVLEVFDENLDLIAENDDGLETPDSQGLESRISNLTADTTQVMFVRVSSFDDDLGELRNYVLSLRRDADDADLVASVIDADDAIVAGTQVEATVRIVNYGFTDAPASTTDFGLTCNQLNRLDPEYEFDQFLFSFDTPALAALDFIDQTVIVDVPLAASGDCVFLAAADGAGVVQETVGDDDPVLLNRGSQLRVDIGAGAGALANSPDRPALLKSVGSKAGQSTAR